MSWLRVSRRHNVDRYYLVSTRWFGVFVHRIKNSEEPGVFHTHPWSWFSIVFGSYFDCRRDAQRPVRGFNWCRAGIAHRVVLVHGPIWSICIRGPRRVRWQVENARGDVLEIEPWTGTEQPERTTYS